MTILSPSSRPARRTCASWTADRGRTGCPPVGSLVEMTEPPAGIVGEYTPVDGVPVSDEAVVRALRASSAASLPELPDVAVQWASRWVPVGR